MKNKEIYRIINEEISKFDFLNFDKVNEEETYYDSLNSKEFQTKLVYDIIHNLDTDQFENVSATYVNTDNDSYNEYDNPSDFELEIDLTYKYEDNKFSITVFVDGEKVSDNEVDYNKTEVLLFNSAGEKIDISWIENNVDLYNSLIDSLVEPYLN